MSITAWPRAKYLKHYWTSDGNTVAKRTEQDGKALVIVESPAKAKTINKYLGGDYVVKASMGHVRDLHESELSVDILNNFEPSYTIVADRKKIVGELRKLAKSAGEVYLATDLDREGEAIAWHLATALEVPENRLKRVVFNEITKSAIQQAFAHPSSIDMDKVNAQQARRVLDRIVGYQLSPLLQQKIARGLSAGRVQSVAVRLIVEREQEIRAFVPSESWRIGAVFAVDLAKAGQLAADWREFLHSTPGKPGEKEALDEEAPAPEASTGPTQKQRIAWLSEHRCLDTELIEVDGKDFKPLKVAEARNVAEGLGFVVERVDEQVWEAYAAKGLKKLQVIGGLDPKRVGRFNVSDIQTKRTTTKPSPPFTTATLQQAAANQLGFSASRTMRTAQALYEGVDLGNGEGPVGLITYMRTDSTNLSKESVEAVRGMIRKEFGEPYLPPSPIHYRSGKQAQEAHEAIRPTDALRHPSQTKGHLSPDQQRLYDLIWRRFVACQMTPAQWDSTTVLITAEVRGAKFTNATFKANGRRLVFDGYQRVMAKVSSDDLILPELSVEQAVAPIDLQPLQKYSAPPPRYSEASLVKALESEGIGRPSTYASIIQTIQDRGYVEQFERRFYATDKGIVVTHKLVDHFPKIMDVKFTSFMEDELDKIEEAHEDWVRVLHEFYDPFQQALSKALNEMQPVRSEPSAYKCPKCGRDMVYRWAKTGSRFLACTGYPECNGAMNIDREGKPIVPPAIDIKCEKCGREMALRQSRHGKFLGCTGYPECSNTIPCDDSGQPLKLVTEKELERPCEDCGEGTMQVKRARGRAFLGCNRYPKCKAASKLPDGVRLERKEEPIEEAGVACEKCGKPMRIRTGSRGKFIACSGYPRCRNAKPIEKLEELRAKQPAAPPQHSTDSTEVPWEEDGADSAGQGSAGTKKAARRPLRDAKAVTGEAPAQAAGKKASAAAGSLGPPPPGFAWTRTGKPVVETWPEGDLHCPNCGKPMTLRNGRFGPFYSCTNFPRCKTSINLRGEAKKRAEQEMPAPQRNAPIPTDKVCDECSSPMVIRTGRTGPFLGCTGYPKCRVTRPVPEEMLASAK